MDDYKAYLGTIAVLLGVISYSRYYWGIFRGYTKPHGFSWLVWGILTGIGFFAVFVSGGGSGSWVLAFTSLACLGIAAIAIYQRHVKYTMFDWLALIGAFFAILLWYVTKDALYAVILLCLSDGIAFLPTFRKAYLFPDEENITSFGLDSIKFIITLFALSSFTLTTALYPAFIALIDSTLVMMVLNRRRQLKQKENPA